MGDLEAVWLQMPFVWVGALLSFDLQVHHSSECATPPEFDQVCWLQNGSEGHHEGRTGAVSGNWCRPNTNRRDQEERAAVDEEEGAGGTTDSERGRTTGRE